MMRTLLLFLFGYAVYGQGIITTVAGTDLVFQGNGSSAVSAPLGRLSRVTVDPNGRPVFADPNYHLIFRVETTGSITVLAGNNVQGLAAGQSLKSGGGYSGDSGPAIYAALNRPVGVAYDASGDLYIGDTANNRIRMVNPQGIITTIAGNGTPAFTGDGPALTESLNYPTDVAVDAAGNVYVNDNQNYRIRKITPQGNMTTIAGTGVEGISSDNVPAAGSPIGDVEGLAVDAQGDVYFAEFSTSRVRRISGGTLTTVAGTGVAAFGPDGPALGVSLNSPGGVAVDSKGDVFISDTGNERVMKLSGGALTTIAGNHQPGFSGDGGAGTAASLHNPFGLAVSPTLDIYIADRDNFRVRHLDTQYVITTVAGNGQLIAGQNGVPAGLAAFLDPYGVSFNAQGSMLIADTDNNIVRQLSANGTLATIAGTGAQETSGDGGQATQAGLFGPFSVTADILGNLFLAMADSGSIRKIVNGSISTVLPIASVPGSSLNVPTQAVEDSSGNLYIADLDNNRIVLLAANGSLTQFPTTFIQPAGLALDNTGNLYVTEFGGGRVQRVSLSTGAATIVAGGGSLAGTAADGGPATKAQLERPAGVTLDSAGNLYFSDFGAAVVRKVALNGTISTIAGNGLPRYFGDGGLAVNASLNGPWGLAFDTSGALYIADVLDNRIRKILNTAPTFTAGPVTLSFTAASNAAVTDPQTLSLSSSLSGLEFAISSDSAWLQATPAGGAMPQPVQVTADPTGLAPGTYTGKLTIAAPGANPTAITVTATFTVQAALPASLGAGSSSLTFSFVTGAAPVSQTLAINNLGSGTVNYSITACASGSAWLSVSPVSGGATATTPGTTNLTITPGQLSPGTYICALTVTASGVSNSPLTIPVSVLVSAPATQLVLSQTGLSFQTITGGGAPLPRGFGILNGGQGAMSWNAQASTLSGGSWLSISPASGSVATPLTDVSQVTVTVNPAGMSAGTYYGLVTVTNSSNPPQTVTVALNVLPSASAAKPDVYPSGMVFTGQTGTNPGSQTFSLANLGSQSVTFTSSRQVAAGDQPWFVHVPTSGTLAPNQPVNIVVQPDFSSLPAGTHQGGITLAFSDGSTLNIVLLGIVSAPATASGDFHPLASCNPSPITITLTGSQSPLTATLDQGFTIQVVMVDNCHNPVTSANGSAGVKFTNGDNSISMTSLPSPPGTWTGSWTPHTAGAVTLHISGQETTPSYALGNLDVSAAVVQPGVQAPLISPGQIVNSASFQPGVPVAPGGLITIFGSSLAGATGLNPSAPLTTSLGDTQVMLGGTPLPLLYASNGQVNAQVPAGLPVNTQQQIQVIRNGNVPSVADQVGIAPASPAIFTVDQSGNGQGAITDSFTGVVKDANSPATAGDFISIYCTGLGVVSPVVPDGQPAGSNPPSSTVNPVTVTIGGVPATVSFAGLSPGFAGLYQVNVQMPSGVPSGNQPVILTEAGQQSPATVTMAVQ
ncbi:MAG TPA: hypothetical protein VME43_07655 [Bryobacteraceae bacterium]|nr:hypothetical protein [Bryobacteraceae bacterium]